MHAFDYPDSPVLRGNRFGSSKYKTFDILCTNKENDEAGRLFLASPDNLTKEKNELCGKISQLLTSQNKAQDNNKLSDIIG